ncbi:hypothetical protein AKO1_008338, partial [Acrasis kona]
SDRTTFDLAESIQTPISCIAFEEQHPNKDICNNLIEMLKTCCVECGDDLLQDFETLLKEYLANTHIVISCQTSKPAALSLYDKSLLQKFLGCKALQYEVDRRLSFTFKHVLVSILALLFGQQPMLIHLEFVDANLLNVIDQNSSLSVQSFPSVSGKRTRRIINSPTHVNMITLVPEWTKKLCLIIGCPTVKVVKDLYNQVTFLVVHTVNQQEVKGVTIGGQRYKFKIDDISLAGEPYPVPAISRSSFDSLVLDRYLSTHCIFNADIKDIRLNACDGCVDCKVHGSSYVDGLLINFDESVTECNSSCECAKCPEKCVNRVSQTMSKAEVQVQKTKKKGWGLFAMNHIPKGSFLGKFLGEIITDEMAQQRDIKYYNRNLSFLFDIGDQRQYCVDGTYCSNYTRYMNHSCDANVVAVNIYVDSVELPEICFFAKKVIRKGEEITLDYQNGFSLPECMCKSPKCRYKIKA